MKVKIFKVHSFDTGYDYSDTVHSLGPCLSDWLEVSDEEYEILIKHGNRVQPHDSKILIVTELDLEKSKNAVKDILEKTKFLVEEERKRQERHQKAEQKRIRAAEERKSMSLAQKVEKLTKELEAAKKLSLTT